MSEIINNLPHIKKRILTSATQDMEIPRFVGLENELIIDYSDTEVSNLEIKQVISPDKNKLQTLVIYYMILVTSQGLSFVIIKTRFSL